MASLSTLSAPHTTLHSTLLMRSLVARAAHAAALPVLFLPVLVGCAPAAVELEVLPPRTSTSCTAPTVKDPAVSRGLLDVQQTEVGNGAYLADLRASVVAANATLDGIKVTLADEDDILKDVKTDVVGGDLALHGEDDAVRVGVLEDVVLFPREAAVAMRDSDANISAVEFVTVTITLEPVVKGEAVSATKSTFALDVCNGCLLEAPTADECPVGVVASPVCRPGQDVDAFTCAAGVVP